MFKTSGFSPINNIVSKNKTYKLDYSNIKNKRKLLYVILNRIKSNQKKFFKINAKFNIKRALSENDIKNLENKKEGIINHSPSLFIKSNKLLLKKKFCDMYIKTISDRLYKGNKIGKIFNKNISNIAGCKYSFINNFIYKNNQFKEKQSSKDSKKIINNFLKTEKQKEKKINNYNFIYNK